MGGVWGRVWAVGKLMSCVSSALGRHSTEEGGNCRVGGISSYQWAEALWLEVCEEMSRIVGRKARIGREAVCFASRGDSAIGGVGIDE